MQLNNTITFIEDLIENTKNKKEKKTLNTFLCILRSLKDTSVTNDQLLLVGEKIESYELSSVQENKQKYLKKKLLEFILFVETDLKLVQEQRYLSLGMSLGMVCGIVISTSFNFDFGMGSQTSGGLIFGMLIGMFIGSMMDKKAQNEKRIYKIKKC